MLRLTLSNNELLNLIKDTNGVDTMFGVAHSNELLDTNQLLDKVRTVFKNELKDNNDVVVTIEDTCIIFDLLGLTTRLNIDGKFMAFNKPELTGLVTLLTFIEPDDCKE